LTTRFKISEFSHRSTDKAAVNQSKLRLELPRIYWINLNRATERRDRMLRAFADFRLPSQRIEAIDGDDKELLAKTIKCDQSTMEKMPHLVAGLASHFIAIRSALMQGDEAALFLEDDVSFEFLSRYPYSYRELLSTLPVGWSGLWLTYGDRPTRLNRIFSMSRLTLQVPYRTLWSTTAYVLSRPAMQYLCNSYWKGDHLDFTDFHDRHE
jgi:GR25 family glycosyltransferase involved in LPS biosynthesis